MKHHLVRLAKLIGLLLAASLTWASVSMPMVAQADTAPPNPADPKTPVSVAADPLPTVQIDGVAWTQRVIGNTVYVGGKFTTARPAGSAAGVNTVTRSNLLAYDIRTGNLITSWAPTTNGDVLSIVPSPDGTRLYLGGSFTTVNGQTRNRIAAVSPSTGALITTFAPKPDATVRAIVATNDTVYMGGLLSSVGGVARTRVAAVKASDGSLLSWAPNAQGGSVHSLIMSPNGSRLVIGGSFTTMNGSGNPGYGLASVDPLTGASQVFNANNLVRDAGANAAITGLSTDGDSLYVSGFVFGSGGNLEGVSRIDWTTTNVVWVEDCHGDTYGTYPKGDLIYVSSHAHYCGNLPDGFPQTDPWTQHYGTAFTKAVTGTLTADPLGYFNWAGNPSPSLQKWLPLLMNGSYTGQGQAGWTVSGNNDYVTYGGEFPTAGGVAQQGLVRYAVKAIAPNKQGPVVTGAKFNPTLASFARGTVKISWKANWDRDNEALTYQVIRNNDLVNPIYTTTQLSSEWKRPGMGFVDKNLVPGQTYRYRVFAKDPLGNEARSDTVTVVVSNDGTISTYAQDVMNDQASYFWRLGEPSGTNVTDWVGLNDATASSGVTRGTAGAITGDTNTASSFDGTGNGLVVAGNSEPAPDTFTAESWIKTTTTSGGKILGFGASNTGNSGSYDRHVYMANNGQLVFGAYANAVRTVVSPKSYNDGQWHHIAASLGSNGMVLSVDGLKVASRADTTSGQQYTGYWRIGGDNLSGWTAQPSSNYFNGAIDDVAIYPSVLSPTRVRQHYTDSGRNLAGATAPADDYGKAVYNSDPDFFWRLSETSGSAATDSGPNQLSGTYDGGVTQGGASGVGVSSDKSATFNGSNGAVAADNTVSNPTVYSEELWFKTNTTQGGKLIGLGSEKFGGSGGYDRHVYMFDDGRLRFGTYTGALNVIDSAKSYNDNQWHQMVATQGADGMKLYVDNQLVGTNAQTGAQDYAGYWRIGGDTTWGGNSSNYFNGSLDEVAVYSKVLTPAEIQDHFGKGGGQLANVNPTADFTSSVNKLKVDFDGSGSADSDGTIASYAWDFGDGATSTVAKPSHTYTSVGAKTVSLTVTDDDGATNVVTKTVTTVANANPVAAFTSSVNKLVVDFDGSGSADSDGTVASYAWDFGDGGTSTVAKPSHTYATAGAKTVTLTVTDDDGATDAVTKTVTASSNAKPVAAFTSSVSQLVVDFDGSGSTDSDGTVASYAWDFGDGGTSTVAKPSHTYTSAGAKTVSLKVTDNDGATDTISKTVTTTAPAGPLAQDAFARTVSNGWGNADTGGTYTRYGTASFFAVTGGVGTIRAATAAAGPRIALESVSSTNTDVQVKVSMDKIADGGGSFVSVGARTIGTNDYRAKVKVAANGALTLYLVKVVSNAETTLTSVNLGSAFNYTSGSTLRIRVQATGTSPTTIRAKAWKTTQTEPAAWQLTTTDSTSGLQVAGGAGLATYLSSTVTNVPIVFSFDDLAVTNAG